MFACFVQDTCLKQDWKVYLRRLSNEVIWLFYITKFPILQYCVALKQCIEGWKSQQKSFASCSKWLCIIIPRVVIKNRTILSRIKSIATEMYKCKNDINPAFVGELFTSHDPPPPIFSKKWWKVEQPIVHTKSFGLNAFWYEGAKIWNGLPNHVKGANDLNEFKGKIRKWSGPSCCCQNCILCSMSLV